MAAILGIFAFCHDSAARIIIDGKIIAAAQEERLTRKKHVSDYPFHLPTLRETYLMSNSFFNKSIAMAYSVFLNIYILH